MAFDAAHAAGLSPRRWSETIAIVFGSVILSLGAAAWISSPDQTAFALAALPGAADPISFEDRYFSVPPAAKSALAWDHSALTILETKLRTARSLLARRLVSEDWRAVFEERSSEEPKIDEAKSDEARVDEAKPSRTALIPLPRSRPATADLESRPGSALAQVSNTIRPDDRTLLQKLSDLLPAGRITLASLAPNGGLFRQGPDLAALGFDNLTAVYDISAHAVYLPSGLSLEAHSGMGNLRDDPEHVSVHMAGATPPAVYDLKPREKPFHGVDALRMTPVEGSDISGRSGLLVHPFMLGPNGDSNGCVSIRNYDRFLKAFNDGEVNRLVVVPSLRSLSTTAMAMQRS
ncbi:MAG TPA: DUF2778 domain-containing protein [Bradyrhizobium sp.]|jgi:hypothetical protein|uniref:DUF2778 domain-containing protein n=1 Tax=Bradyrhizobium sp. TaxID=376 RepID=UPI002C748B88|nr:DUF2778 domain-containing protein [Bradyrhizobium sp.]HXB75889.1 DUF2778 domain-containing protein [Bradyrhizobium sp.]